MIQIRTKQEILESAIVHLNNASNDLGELSNRKDKFKEYFFATNRILRSLQQLKGIHELTESQKGIKLVDEQRQREHWCDKCDDSYLIAEVEYIIRGENAPEEFGIPEDYCIMAIRLLK